MGSQNPEEKSVERDGAAGLKVVQIRSCHCSSVATRRQQRSFSVSDNAVYRMYLTEFRQTGNRNVTSGISNIPAQNRSCQKTTTRLSDTRHTPVWLFSYLHNLQHTTLLFFHGLDCRRVKLFSSPNGEKWTKKARLDRDGLQFLQWWILRDSNPRPTD